MNLRDLVYSVYERRLTAKLAGRPVPRHVGVMCDGNRRWAKEMGYVDPNDGHRVGAEKVKRVIRWCDQARIEHVTLYLLATDNLRRPASELDPLLQIIEDLVVELAEEGNPWRLRIVGALDLLPASTAAALKAAQERTRDRVGGAEVNIAVGYGGRREIADAVRSLLQEHAARGGTIEELAEVLDVEHIAEHLYTRGQPDPDLVIRTSGEQRLSGFLLWQSAHSEFYFCDVNWPDFRHVDFLRALRSYASRQRRYGALSFWFLRSASLRWACALRPAVFALRAPSTSCRRPRAPDGGGRKRLRAAVGGPRPARPCWLVVAALLRACALSVFALRAPAFGASSGSRRRRAQRLVAAVGGPRPARPRARRRGAVATCVWASVGGPRRRSAEVACAGGCGCG